MVNRRFLCLAGIVRFVPVGNMKAKARLLFVVAGIVRLLVVPGASRLITAIP